VTWSRLTGSARHLALSALCISALYPIVFVVFTALKTNQDYTLDPLGLPTAPTLDNFSALLDQAPILDWLLNSVVVTAAAVSINTVAGFLAAYALVFGTARGREVFLRSSIAFMAMPSVVLLPAIYVLMNDIRLTNTLLSVILVFGGLMTPFATFVFANFLSEIPSDLHAAARVDGASPFQILRHVVLPLSKAALGTVAMVTAVTVWNDLLLPLVFLQENEKRTLVAGLVQFDGPYVSNVPLIMAGACFVLAPLLAMFVFGQRYFVRGTLAGIGK
jgi:raffinose/stachyose/melibiose transport system permease protein